MNRLSLSLAAALAALSSTAHASGVALETWDPAPAGDRFLAVPDANVLSTLSPALSLQAGWAHHPLSVYDSRGALIPNGRLVQDQVGLRAAASASFADLVLVDAALSMAAWQRGQAPFAGQSAISTAAFSDPRLGARLALLRGEQLSLSAGLSVWVPLGSQTNYASDGMFRALPQVLASGRSGAFRWASQAGIDVRKRAVQSLTSDGPAVRLGAAGGMMFLNDALQVGPELYGRARFSNAGTSSVEALLSARYELRDLSFSAGIGHRFLNEAPGAAPLRIVAQVTFLSFDWLGARRGAAVHAAPLAAVAPAPAPAPAAPEVPVAAPVEAVAAVEPAAPAPEAIAPEPPPLVQVESERIELREPVQFAKNGAVLLSSSDPVLTATAAALQEHPQIGNVLVAGFSDDRGTPRHNQQLTAARARAVRAWLVKHGIAASRLDVRGCGSASPIAPNDSEEGRARNRRVELRLPAADGAKASCR